MSRDQVGPSAAGGELPAVRPSATVDLVVPYADTDAQGRVYYGRYARYLDEARFALWAAAGYDEPGLRRIEHAVVTARLEIEYHGPAEFHDRLRVSAGIESLGRTSVIFRYVVHHADDRPVLDARQVCVQVDFARGARPTPWSEADRTRLGRLVGA